MLDNVESRTLGAMGNSELSYAFSDRLRLNGRVGVDMLNLRDFALELAADHRHVCRHGAWWRSRKHDGQPLCGRDVPAVGRAGAALWTALPVGDLAEYNSRENDFLQGEGFGSTQFRWPLATPAR
ncbi:MAG: hypothetical protein IPJ56_18180 [Gemmatimonadetes bacterium]|nr:hypothetical protein [Gemmatimonadota bacterium]